MPSLTLTIDLEDASGVYSAKGRYIDMTYRLLDLCADANTKATFFTVGKVARAAPDLIRRISSLGHEVAYHSHAHLHLTMDSPGRLKEQTLNDKSFIEDVTGKQLLGYRAPGFSLMPKTQWVTDTLKELGFLYSSSIMPTTISRYGFRTASDAPFLWPCGLLELPLPMTQIGMVKLPYSGGIYLYCWPMKIVERFLKAAQPNTVLWTYIHPQDVDIHEPFCKLPDAPTWMSLILWLMRDRAEKKMRLLLSKTDIGAPLGEVAHRLLTQTALPVHAAE